MDTSYYEYEEKSQRRRVVAITAIIAVVVLIITSWAIVQIISNASTETSEEVVAVDEVAAVDDGAKIPATEGVTSEGADAKNETEADLIATEQNDVVENETQSVAALSSVSSVPETGAEELLPLALVAGSGAAFITSRKLAKSEVKA